VFTTAGDAFSVAFARAGDAVGAALEAQLGLVSERWPVDDELVQLSAGVIGVGRSKLGGLTQPRRLPSDPIGPFAWLAITDPFEMAAEVIDR
jgi:hypothetical protein